MYVIAPSDKICNKLDKKFILVFFSPKLKRRAEAVLSLPCLEYDDGDQLMYERSPVFGTHMADLVKLCITQFQNCNLRGYNDLCDILSKKNHPPFATIKCKITSCHREQTQQ